MKVAISAEAVWALGFDHDAREARRQDYLVVEKYTLDGRRVGSFLPRTSFPRNQEPAFNSGVGAPTSIAAYGDRIGIYSSTSHEWIELSAAAS